MTTTNTPIALRRRLYRRAITVTALAVFVTTTAVTLLAPVPAAAQSPAIDGAASERVAVARKKSRGKSGKSAPKKAKSSKKSKAKKGPSKLVGVVNINTASAADLEMLPGVGPTKAERVLEHRSKRGKFRRVKDLRRVKGFGRKSLTKLAPYLTIKGPTTIALVKAAD